MIIQALWHFWNFAPGDTLNTEIHGGKNIGIYLDEAGALAAIAKLACVEGFRDHPDGFRLFPFEVDRAYWREGFAPGPDGTDRAIAGDGSGIFGSDDALAENSHDTDRDFAFDRHYISLKAVPDAADEFWVLEHYKISRLNSQSWEDMGHKFVGYFSTRQRLNAAVRRLRTKPGFYSWPQGFRVGWAKLDGLNWSEGFVRG